MSATNGNGHSGPSRLLGADGSQIGGLPKNARDKQGRLMRTNATVLEAHQIAIEEANNVTDFHFRQLPPYLIKLIQDALIQFGLVELAEDGTTLRPVMAGLQACPDCGSVTRISRVLVDEGARVECRVCASPKPSIALMTYEPPRVVSSDAPPTAENPEGHTTGAIPLAASDDITAP